MAAIIIGAGVALISFFAIRLKHLFHYDDTLDVFGVHGVGGAWGAIATGLFASTAINSAGANGLFSGGGFKQVGIQAVAVVAAVAYAALVTFIIIKVLGAIMGLRVSTDEENAGLDLGQHGEAGYSGLEAEGAMMPVLE